MKELQILKALGFKQEQLDPLLVDGADIAKLTEPLHDALIQSYKATKKFTDDVESAALGRVMGETQRKLIKAFDLTPSDDNKLEKFDDILSAAKKKAEEHPTKTVTELQAVFAKKEKAWEDERTGLVKEKETVQQTYENKLVGVTVNNWLTSKVSALQNEKQKLISPLNVIMPYLSSKLSSEYTLTAKDGVIRISQKDKPEADVYDGAKKLSAEDVLVKILTDEKLLVELKKPGGGSSRKVETEEENVPEVKTGTYKSEGLELARKNAELQIERDKKNSGSN
jgi:hypothetical protein